MTHRPIACSAMGVRHGVGKEMVWIKVVWIGINPENLNDFSLTE